MSRGFACNLVILYIYIRGLQENVIHLASVALLVDICFQTEIKSLFTARG